jgi:choline dehydrogenase
MTEMYPPAFDVIPNFDFIIVGAGSAGCVLADALSRNGRYSVAIIEAGGSDRKFFVQMPLGYGKTFYDKSLNWGYRAEPDKGLNGQCDYWPRGKVLGGSSSINAMVWIRGDAADFDSWAAEGNPGWAYDDLLPVFKRLEDNQAGADAWRGTGGPLHISDVSHDTHPLAKRFIKAGLQAGFSLNPDFNGKTQEGVGTYQINTKDGWRMSAAKAFLRPALKRANVTLFSNAHVLKIIMSENRATGIEMRHKDRICRLSAGREIILSAGAVNSPQLLQLSGIGPQAILHKAGIATVLESPSVGNHMQDHLGINYIYRSKIATLNDTLRPWWGKLQAGIAFLAFGKGPLSLSLNQGGGFVRSDLSLERPDIQLYCQAISTLTAKTGTRPLLEPDPFSGFALGLSNCRPKARGSIHIACADPFAPPRIHANAFGGEGDMETMLAGVKLLRKLANQDALSEIIDAELAPGPSVRSDNDLIQDARNRSGTVYHPVGTCRMGRDIATATVDARLRVHGIKGLRVADASVFPSIISGNTNASAMMVGAKAAMMILEDSQN